MSVGMVNNTSKMTTSGALTILDERGDHLYSGVETVFPNPVPVGVNEGFVFELLSTLSGTVHLSGGCLVEEVGG